jgi:hypothetical protein
MLTPQQVRVGTNKVIPHEERHKQIRKIMTKFTVYDITDSLWIETTITNKSFEIDVCEYYMYRDGKDSRTIFSIFIFNPFYRMKNK